MAATTRIGRDVPAPYQAGGNGRRLRGWMAPGSGPNSAAVGNTQTLRNRSRQQTRNNGYGHSLISKLVSNIIGTGIRPRSMASSKAFQSAAQELWKESSRQMDPEGLLDAYGQQAQAVRTWLDAGESFLRMRSRRPSDGLRVPMQVQVMEPEMCPLHYYGYNGRNRIRNGIEFDSVGRRVAYYFYKAHPGDATLMSIESSQLTRVPAREVIHLFDPIRPGQIRGVVKMAPVLMKLWDTDKLDDANALRHQIANLWAGFVTNKNDDPSPVPSSFGGETDPADDDDDGNGSVDPLGLEPGMIQELLEGQGIEFSNPPDPSANYGDLLKGQLRAVAAGGDVPYEVMTGDFTGINDRLARVILNEFRRGIQMMQHHNVIHQMCHRMWAEWWMPKAVQSAVLTAPGFAVNPRQYTKAKHVPHAWPYIHPEQDVNTAIKDRRAGFKTRAAIIAERTGEDVDDVDQGIAAEDTQADELGNVYDTDPRYTNSAGARMADPWGSNDAATTDAAQQS